MNIEHPRMMNLAGVGGIIALTSIAYAVCVHPVVREYRVEQEAQIQAVFVQEDLAKARRESEQAMSRKSLLDEEVAGAFIPATVSSLNAKSEKITFLAERCGLVVSRLRPAEPIKGASITDVPLSMSGECDYQSFHAFLALMRVEAPDVAVESFDLSTESDNGAVFRAKLVWHACNESIITAVSKSDDAP